MGGGGGCHAQCTGVLDVLLAALGAALWGLKRGLAWEWKNEMQILEAVADFTESAVAFFFA
jgi:hypothetical protein